MKKSTDKILLILISSLAISGSIALLFIWRVGTGLYFYLFLSGLFLFFLLGLRLKNIGITFAFIWTLCILYVVQKKRKSIHNVVVLVPPAYEGYIRIGFSSNNGDGIKIIKGNALLDMRENTCNIFQEKYFKNCYDSPLYVAESMSSSRIPDSNILFKQIDTVRSSTGNTYWFNFFLLQNHQNQSKADINEIIKRYSYQLVSCQ